MWTQVQISRFGGFLMFEYLKHLNNCTLRELDDELHFLLELDHVDSQKEYAVKKIEYVKQEIIFRKAMGA